MKNEKVGAQALGHSPSPNFRGPGTAGASGEMLSSAPMCSQCPPPSAARRPGIVMRTADPSVLWQWRAEKLSAGKSDAAGLLSSEDSAPQTVGVSHAAAHERAWAGAGP